MKSIRGVVSSTVLALSLTLSQAGAVFGEDKGEGADIAAAMKLYSQALPMEVNSPQRAELLDQSAGILNEVIKKNPQSLDAHRKLMGVYLLKQDYTRGISTMQDAITLSPEDPKLFIALAFLYEHSGALEYSMAMLDQALSLDPDHKLAKEYKVAIKQKIDKFKMDELHQAKDVMDSSHGKATVPAHPPVETQK
ncbi:MAG: cytochrome C biogenesis protein [Candidatus Sedimenticola sp. 6PFRAG5]